MYRNPRLISGIRRSGKRLYGSSMAARLKTNNEEDSPTLSVPSAKTWARLPQNRSSNTTRVTVSSSRRDAAAQKEAARGVGVLKRTGNPSSSLGQTSKLPGNYLPTSKANAAPKNLGKWAFPASPGSPKNGSPGLSNNNAVKKRSPSDPPRPPARGKWPVPPHITQSSDTRNSMPRSLNLRHQGERLRSPFEHPFSKSTPASTSTNTDSLQPSSIPSRPDYTSFQVFREDEDDDRRTQRRKRDNPERKTLREHNRREAVLNKAIIKKSPKPKMKKIIRRRDVFIPSTLTVAMLSRLLNVKLTHLLNKMRQVGMEVEASYDYILSADYAALLAEEFGFNPVIDDEAAFDIYPPKPHPNPATLPSRPPIVTIMGHVDHGKTTLLDTLRSASVAKGEAGGITQHIGAFSVAVANQSNTGPRSITFLDTPGHAAFSAMRARGANVTDIVVLVVAADDGIMPQTEEVINLLNRENHSLDLVVAINKIDKPDADPDPVKKALMVYGVQLEDFGGDIPAVHVSGLTGEGLPTLIDTLSAVAEVRDLRADQAGPVYGHVIESNIHKGLGSTSTVLIRQGCLKVGSHIISGTTQGKVRRMTDSSGQTVQTALPGMAVTVSGWKSLPKAGDEVLDGCEADIKRAIVNRLRREETEALQQDAEAINESRRQERDARAEGEDTLDAPIANIGPKELRLLIKGDVSGSCEALEGALNNIGNNIAISKVIHTGVGDITESDILMAKAANATIVGFSVSASRSILSLATQNEVPVSTGNIIYRLIDDVRSRIIDMLPKLIETKVTGEATVLQLFNITAKSKQILKVAGCRITNGLVEKHKFARVIRDGSIIHEGSLDTMRQLKKEITEARKGTECGLTLKEFSDLQEEDMIQMYERIEKPGVI